MSDNAIPVLPRQSGLMQVTQAIANNIANAATPGYKSEGAVFSEFVAASGGAPSVSMGRFTAQTTDFTNGALDRTGGTFDLALSGEGFFKVSTPQGDRLTRAGAFTPNAEGTLVDTNGFAVLDDGGSTIEIPPDAADIGIAGDGTISIDGEVFGLIGVFMPEGEALRAGNNLWNAPDGDRAIETRGIVQGALETSNVDPVMEFAKLIQAQRMFDAGQTNLEQEHERLSALIRAIRQE